MRAAGHELIGTDAAGAEHALDLRDRAAVVDALARWRPALVVHAGAISGAMLAQDDPALMFDVNVNGTLSVLEGMRQAGTPRLVYLSSNAVYRARDDRAPVDEDAALDSDEPYGASKVAAEALVSAYAATAGIDAWMLRISSIYGPGRRTPYLISTLTRRRAVARCLVSPTGAATCGSSCTFTTWWPRCWPPCSGPRAAAWR